MYPCGVDIHARQYDTVPILTIVVTDSVLTPQGIRSILNAPSQTALLGVSASVGPAVCK